MKLSQIGFRHCTASLLAGAGVYPKVAQSLLRHSDVNLTMGIYTHTMAEEESIAVAKLPLLSLANSAENEDFCLSFCLASGCEKPRITANCHEHKKGKRSSDKDDCKSGLEASKQRFLHQKLPVPEVGLEPTPCCQDGILNPVRKECNLLKNKIVKDDTEDCLASCLALFLHPCPELATIISIWPKLPQPIKSAIQALIQTCSEQYPDSSQK